MYSKKMASDGANIRVRKQGSKTKFKLTQNLTLKKCTPLNVITWF